MFLWGVYCIISWVGWWCERGFKELVKTCLLLHFKRFLNQKASWWRTTWPHIYQPSNFSSSNHLISREFNISFSHDMGHARLGSETRNNSMLLLGKLIGLSRFRITVDSWLDRIKTLKLIRDEIGTISFNYPWILTKELSLDRFNPAWPSCFFSTNLNDSAELHWVKWGAMTKIYIPKSQYFVRCEENSLARLFPTYLPRVGDEDD